MGLAAWSAQAAPPATFREEDLTHLFPAVEKPAQAANTCYLHVGVALIEAALGRASAPEAAQGLDDSLVLLSFLDSVLARDPRAPDPKWLEAERSLIGLNAFFFSRGKLKSPIDYGMLNPELLRFLLRKPLYGPQPGSEAEVSKAFQDIRERLAARSREMQENPPPKHPTLMTPSELLAWPRMRKALRETRETASAALKRIAPERMPLERFKGWVAESVPVDALLLDEESENVRWRLKESLKPYRKSADRPATSAEAAELEAARSECSRLSSALQARLEGLLRRGIPVGVGLYPNGVEFLPRNGQEGSYQKVYFNNLHAMTLTGLRAWPNERGEPEPYFVFRDSGFFQGSRLARMPVRESCRILSAVALYLPSERD